MSARMIALAINIALMGFALVAGVGAYLSRALPGPHNAAQVRALSESIAAGHLVAFDQNLAHAALVHGFGWVMLYGAASVWILAAASFLTFGPATNRQSQRHGEAHATTCAQCAD